MRSVSIAISLLILSSCSSIPFLLKDVETVAEVAEIAVKTEEFIIEEWNHEEGKERCEEGRKSDEGVCLPQTSFGEQERSSCERKETSSSDCSK